MRTVQVDNDAAKKGLKLNTDYYATIPTDHERQKSSLMQAEEKHRQDYPDFRKYPLAEVKL